jgi:hypothetical protein
LRSNLSDAHIPVLFVIPAKAGIQTGIDFQAIRHSWIPAFAGMTMVASI